MFASQTLDQTNEQIGLKEEKNLSKSYTIVIKAKYLLIKNNQ